MGLSFGALGIMLRSARLPLAPFKAMSVFPRIANLVEPRSLFLSFVFVVVTIILAYLTNPTEASFRNYLTELSFRRHFSPYYDAQNSKPGSQDCEISGLHTPKRHHQQTKHPSKDLILSSQTTPTTVSGFHFSNRASISLRTPGLIFRSLGVLTVAAVPIVTDKATDVNLAGQITPSASEKAEVMLDGSWFIGIFGKWWLGGTLQLRQRSASCMDGKDDTFTAGVLGVRALDAFDCDIISEGLKTITDSISAITSKSRKATRNSSSGSAKHERSRSGRRSITNLGSAHGANGPLRSGSPPPLPKSASLPLHQTRPPQSGPEGLLAIKSVNPLSQTSPFNPSTNAIEPTHRIDSSFSASNSNSISLNNQGNNSTSNVTPTYGLDESPIIVDILNQIKVVQDGVDESRNHLAAFQASAATSHDQLQSTLEGCREKKREDDLQRVDFRQQQKAVEDSKRQTENSKRDAERRLKIAQSARDRAANRMEQLSRDIGVLKTRIAENKHRVAASEVQANEQERVLQEKIEDKKKEIKVAEDLVAALTLRARELQAQIEDEEKALVKAKADAKERVKAVAAAQAARAVRAVQVVPAPVAAGPATVAASGIASPHSTPANSSPSVPLFQRRSVPQSFEPQTLNTAEQAFLPPFLQHGAFGPPVRNDATNQLGSLGRRHSTGHTPSTTHPESSAPYHDFSPFTDHSLMSPTASSLIPTSLFSSLDSDDGSQLGASPTDSFSISSAGEPYDANRAWRTTLPVQGTWNDGSEILYTSPATPYLHTPSTTHFPSQAEQETVSSTPRRWLASSLASRHATSTGMSSNLNPDAKVFNFSRGRSYLFPPGGVATTNEPTSANINPQKPSFRHPGSSSASRSSFSSLPIPSPSQSNSTSPLISAASSTTSFLSSLLAFTPSPAEREALQRALGQSHPNFNSSMEKLSLPDHSSPSLSSHSHYSQKPSPPQQHLGPSLGTGGSSIWGGSDFYLSNVNPRGSLNGRTGPSIFVPRAVGLKEGVSEPTVAAGGDGDAGSSSNLRKTFSLWSHKKERSNAGSISTGSEGDFGVKDESGCDDGLM